MSPHTFCLRVNFSELAQFLSLNTVGLKLPLHWGRPAAAVLLDSLQLYAQKLTGFDWGNWAHATHSPNRPPSLGSKYVFLGTAHTLQWYSLLSPCKCWAERDRCYGNVHHCHGNVEVLLTINPVFFSSYGRTVPAELLQRKKGCFTQELKFLTFTSQSSQCKWWILEETHHSV